MPGRGSTDGIDSTTGPCGPTARRWRGSGGRCAGSSTPPPTACCSGDVEHCLALRPMTAAIAMTNAARSFDAVSTGTRRRSLPRWPAPARAGHARRPHARQRAPRRRRTGSPASSTSATCRTRRWSPTSSRRSTRCSRPRRATTFPCARHRCSTATRRSRRSSRGARAARRRSARPARAHDRPISAWRVERYPENARVHPELGRRRVELLELFDELGFDDAARRLGAARAAIPTRRAGRAARRRSSARRSRR